MRAAIYARVSTLDQQPENQLQELRRYVSARGWAAVEYADRGVSGAKDRRPALDQLLADARRRRFDVVVCWRLDRLGRNLKHLITLLEEVHALGIAFVSFHFRPVQITAEAPLVTNWLQILVEANAFRDRVGVV
jgi:DNA invertase Pin-like site-specific DNA recombinase